MSTISILWGQPSPASSGPLSFFRASRCILCTTQIPQASLLFKRRSQRSRRTGYDWFDAVTARYPLPPVRITRSWAEQRIWRV
jgi:hypothetical protein